MNVSSRVRSRRTAWLGVGAFAISVMIMALMPSGRATATSCAWHPEGLFLELESVTIDGAPVDSATAWAHLLPRSYGWREPLERVTMRIEGAWTDEWELDGGDYDRVED